MSDLYIKVSVCLLLLSQLPCWAVAGEDVWGSVTSENGLSDNSIHCILRDRLGFVWLGSNRGPAEQAKDRPSHSLSPV